VCVCVARAPEETHACSVTQLCACACVDRNKESETKLTDFNS